jgi:hypothetical protein
MMACECGVPRLMKSASTFLSSISVRAFSPARLTSKASSMRSTSIFSPWMPPWALAASITSCAPPMVSFTLAATDPVMPAVWPIRIWADAPMAVSASRAVAQSVRIFVMEPPENSCKRMLYLFLNVSKLPS